MRPAQCGFVTSDYWLSQPLLQFPAEHISGSPLGSQHPDVLTGNQAEAPVESRRAPSKAGPLHQKHRLTFLPTQRGSCAWCNLCNETVRVNRVSSTSRLLWRLTRTIHVFNERWIHSSSDIKGRFVSFQAKRKLRGMPLRRVTPFMLASNTGKAFVDFYRLSSWIVIFSIKFWLTATEGQRPSFQNNPHDLGLQRQKDACATSPPAPGRGPVSWSAATWRGLSRETVNSTVAARERRKRAREFPQPLSPGQGHQVRIKD